MEPNETSCVNSYTLHGNRITKVCGHCKAPTCSTGYEIYTSK